MLRRGMRSTRPGTRGLEVTKPKSTGISWRKNKDERILTRSTPLGDNANLSALLNPAYLSHTNTRVPSSNVQHRKLVLYWVLVDRVIERQTGWFCHRHILPWATATTIAYATAVGTGCWLLVACCLLEIRLLRAIYSFIVAMHIAVTSSTVASQ